MRRPSRTGNENTVFESLNRLSVQRRRRLQRVRLSDSGWASLSPPIGLLGSSADLHTALCASVSRKNGNHADRRVSSGPRPDCEVRVLSTTSRSVGWTWLGAVTTVTRGPDGCSCSSASAGIRASKEAKNCLPESVMHQPRSSRSTNELAKISSFGARTANRRIRSVQSDPLDIRMLT